MNNIISPISSENLKDCINLYIQTFNKNPWNQSWTYELVEERLTDLLNTPKFLGFAFYSNNSLIGFIAGHSKKSSNGLNFYLEEFCLNTEISTEAYASKMIQYLENELQLRQVNTIFALTVNQSLIEEFYKQNHYLGTNSKIFISKDLN